MNALIATSATEKSYWDAVEILLRKPHVVNKRLWGCKSLFRERSNFMEVNTLLNFNFDHFNDKYTVEEYKEKILHQIQTSGIDDLNTTEFEVILFELLPKTYTENHAYQVAVIKRSSCLVEFYNVTSESSTQNLCPAFSYAFIFKNNTIELSTQCDGTSKSYEWLKGIVLPQLVKWGEEIPNKTVNICNESLNLVPNEEYYRLYNDLKVKYGKEMVNVWPECTDPSKFVYEDIAIATYLLLLWKHHKSKNSNCEYQTFVDLGCGNGLLVYILTKEGHMGVGIDVRKRNIWDMYPKNVNLEEKTIYPSDTHLFPETDWIIGNHSDELTPWIPVIAARSSYKCNFFLLPCCAYNFDGTKYQRQNSSKSLYNDYMQYIKNLCKSCGFQTEIDRLKIPSTKRICFIGKGRNYIEEQQNENCMFIQNIINKTSNSTQQQDNATWIKDIKTRDPIEKVRNCTQIDKKIIESLVGMISKHLLANCKTCTDWNIGEPMELSEIVKLIPEGTLKHLKSECGGLQTLLRNNHQIFEVHGGKVQLRYPKTVEQVMNGKNKNKNAKSIKIKQKICWFYNNHPQGCPLTDLTCSFQHIKVLT